MPGARLPFANVGRMLCSAFVASTSALQSKPAAYHQAVMVRNATVAADDFDLLDSYFRTRCDENWCGQWETCQISNQYQHYKNSLPRLSMSDFQLPPNVSILFYGHSFLRQVEDYIYIANLENDVLGEQVDLLPSKTQTNCEAYKWKSKVNSVITHISNCEELQRSTQADELKGFLKEHGPFDVAFFMAPHKDCYFDDPFDLTRSRCTDEEKEDEGMGNRSDVDALWAAVAGVVTGKTYEVEAWPQMWAWSFSKGWDLRRFHADEEFVIRTNPTLEGHACNCDDDCQSYPQKFMGHQCQPGLLGVIAKSIMAKVHIGLSEI